MVAKVFYETKCLSLRVNILGSLVVYVIAGSSCCSCHIAYRSFVLPWALGFRYCKCVCTAWCWNIMLFIYIYLHTYIFRSGVRSI